MPKELNVTDVTFEDVGDRQVPPEHEALFREYEAELEWLTRPGTTVTTLFWCAQESHYTNRMLPKDKHKAYTKSLLCSGDPGKIEAAIEAMKRLLLKWDSSRGVAKLNADAYASRERQKLRAKSAPKIQAWEEECRRNPYYRDQAGVDAMKDREEEKLMGRVQAYQEKWRSHPCTIPDPQLGEDGYLIVEMPERWTRREE